MTLIHVTFERLRRLKRRFANLTFDRLVVRRSRGFLYRRNCSKTFDVGCAKTFDVVCPKTFDGICSKTFDVVRFQFGKLLADNLGS